MKSSGLIVSLIGVAALAVSGTAIAQTWSAPVQIAQVRPERGSDRNLVVVRRRIEGLIDQLQRDQHDYSGYRVRAIGDLQSARADIDQALQHDRSDGR